MDVRSGLLAALRRRVGLQVLTLLAVLSLGSGATLLVVGSRAAHAATATITTCDFAHVSSAISGAAAGDVLQFGCGGTVAVTSTLNITKNLTLDGNGHSVTLDGGGSMQVLSVAGGVTAIFNDLTITHGAANAHGGGIGNAGDLTITSSTVSNNTDHFSGGGILNQGSLTIADCTISGNTATIFGGGIANLNGTITITNSTISGNTATKQQAGGILNAVGTATITGSTFANNSGTQAGAIENGDTMTITDSTFSTNAATSFGGGALQNDGTITITGSTFTGNTAHGGAGMYNFGTATITASTFTGNASAGSGGALLNTNISGPLTVINSTFSTNSASNSGGAIYDGGPAAITGSTFAGNSSPDGGALNLNGLNGGELQLGDTILASSSSSPNCSFTGTIGDMGYNLDDGTSCGFTTANHDVSNTDPKLGALASNGGPTQTMALLPGSPAIDTGGTSANGCPATDQRTISRPQGSACDIGAYEFVPTTTTTLVASPTTAVSGQNVQLCATVKAAATNSGTPIGSVTFQEGSASLGSSATLSAGKACVNVATLALGTHSISAAYGGGGGFSASTSAPVSVVIGVPGQDVAGSAGSAPGNPQSAPGAEGSDNPAVQTGQTVQIGQTGQQPAMSSGTIQGTASSGPKAPHAARAPGLWPWLPLGLVLLLLGLGGLGFVLFRSSRARRAAMVRG